MPVNTPPDWTHTCILQSQDHPQKVPKNILGKYRTFLFQKMNNTTSYFVGILKIYFVFISKVYSFIFKN